MEAQTTPVLGADVSVYNFPHGIPWEVLPKMARAGMRFVIARASVGLKIDPSFAKNRHRTFSASWIPGAYHYLADSSPGADQAQTFMAQLNDSGGPSGILKGLDVEDDRVGQTNIVSLAQVRAFVQAFHGAWPHQQLKLYSNRSTWGRLGNPDITDLGFDSAWHAYYGGGWDPAGRPAQPGDPNAKPPIPPTPATPPGSHMPARPPIGFGGEGRIALWQGGPIHVQLAPNKVKTLDGDAWYGTLAELRADSVAERPPLQDRKPYKLAFNDQLDLIEAGIVAPGGDGGTPAQKAGTWAAIEAARDAVSGLKIGGI